MCIRDSAHTQNHCPWPQRKEEVDARLLLYRCCHRVESLYTQTHCLWPQRKEELDARVLLYRFCHRVELVSYRDGVIAAAAERKGEIVGKGLRCWAARRCGTQSGEKRAGSRDFESPDHTPRSPAGAQPCAVVYTRAPCVPRSRERDRFLPERQKRVCISLYMHILLLVFFLVWF